MLTKFRFKNPRYNRMIDSIIRSGSLKSVGVERLNFLRFLYGNALEIAHKKLYGILDLDVPSDDKEIAWEIYGEECDAIHAEFAQELADWADVESKFWDKLCPLVEE